MPRDYRLADGDLLTLDLAIVKDGIAADAAISFIVGNTRAPEDVAMIAATEQALTAVIAVAGPAVRPGLLLALEPWVMADTDRLIIDPDDGWTLRSSTGCRTAHSEHTIAITASGAEILTLPSRNRNGVERRE